jgi:excinuclease ABC subunit A
VPKNFSEAEVLKLLEQQGYTRIHARSGGCIEVIQDRLRISGAERARVIDALEAALKVGRGPRERVPGDGRRHDGKTLRSRSAARGNDESKPWRFSSDLHCPDCDIHYRDPTPSLFSFNSPLGACDTCRGFGRVIGVRLLGS